MEYKDGKCTYITDSKYISNLRTISSNISRISSPKNSKSSRSFKEIVFYDPKEEKKFKTIEILNVKEKDETKN